MSNKHERILEAIFKNPVQSNVNWKDCEKLLKFLGAEFKEGEGSRIRILLNKKKAVFHRPHPQKETDKGALVSLRKFLESAGIKFKEEE